MHLFSPGSFVNIPRMPIIKQLVSISSYIYFTAYMQERCVCNHPHKLTADLFCARQEKSRMGHLRQLFPSWKAFWDSLFLVPRYRAPTRPLWLFGTTVRHKILNYWGEMRGQERKTRDGSRQRAALGGKAGSKVGRIKESNGQR